MRFPQELGFSHHCHGTFLDGAQKDIILVCVDFRCPYQHEVVIKQKQNKTLCDPFQSTPLAIQHYASIKQNVGKSFFSASFISVSTDIHLIPIRSILPCHSPVSFYKSYPWHQFQQI